MKKIALVLIAAISIIGCTKKNDNNNVTPGYVAGASIEKTNGAIVKLVCVPYSSTTDKYLDVQINYLGGNTGTYAYDVLMIYNGASLITSKDPSISGINKSEEIKTDKFDKSITYHLLFIRAYVSGVKDTIVDFTGN